MRSDLRRGVSLVEIMVGLVLGLILVAGLSHLVLGARQTSRAERNLLELQATGRVAIEALSREIRKAGYSPVRELAQATLFPAAAAPFTTAGAVVVGTGATQVDVRLQGTGDGWTTDCLGNAVPAGDDLWQTLSLTGGQVVCRTRNLTAGTDQSLALVPQVEAMSLTYGIDTDGDGYADVYQAAAAVTDWSRVASVNLQLRLVSADNALADFPQPYADTDGTVVTPTDQRLRRNFSTVIALRNLLP
jgi:type IV pilus assembly protein PilW